MMRILIISLAIVLPVENLSLPGAGIIGDVQVVSNFAIDALGVLSGDLPLSALFMGSNEMGKLAEKMDQLSDQISEMSTSIENQLNRVLDRLVTRLPLLGQCRAAMQQLHDCIVRIDELYDDFQIYTSVKFKISNYTLENFMHTITTHQTGSMGNVINKMYRLVVPERSSTINDGLLYLVAQDINQLDYKVRFNDKILPQQRMFEIYNIILVTEARGYAMTIFAYAILTAIKNESFAEEGRIAKRELVGRIKDYIEMLQSAMKIVPRNFERLHPSHRKFDETYTKLTNIQMFLVAEPDVNSDRSCTGDCWDVNAPKVYGCYDNSQWCPRRTCKGQVYYCSPMGGNRVCETTSNIPERYQFITDDRDIYGRKIYACRGFYGEADPWTRGFVKCDICLCICAEDHDDSTTIRMISLRPQISNIDENMVVIGVRFMRRDIIIHIQIQEGQLLSDGRINNSTARWIDLEDLKVHPNKEGAALVTKTDENQKSTNMTADIDYAIITRFSRTMFLDDVTLPHGYVVTGIRWNHEQPTSDGKPNKSPHQIEIRGTAFDFKTGTLKPNSSIWVTPQNMTDRPKRYDKKRDEVTLNKPNDPAYTKDTLPDSEVNQFMIFRTTDAKSDVGQNTVPFFDIQPLQTPIGLALNGIGIFHRGADLSGGFFALRTIDLDLSQFLNSTITEDTIIQ